MAENGSSENGQRVSGEETSGLSLKGKDIMPSLGNQKTISSLTFCIMCIGFYVQLAAFISGAQMYPIMSPINILLFVFLGNLVVWVLLVLTGDIGLKHGVPYSVYIRAPFGYLGAHFPGLVRAIPAIYWFGFQTWLGSVAINEVLKYLFHFDNLTLVIIIFGALQILNTAYGVDAIAAFDWVAAPVLTITGIYITYFLITNYDVSWSTLSAPGTGSIGALKAVTIFAGAQITMAVNIADFTRFMKRGESNEFFKLNRGSMWSQFIGLILPMVLFSGIGMISGIATGEWNPIIVMTQVFADNPVVMILVLLSFVVFAQVSSNTGQNLLPPGYVFVNLFPRKVTFPQAVIAAGVIGLVCVPWKFADQINSIYLIITCMLGPIIGIMISDYYFLRKRRLNIEELYKPGSQYTYYKNFNPAALIVFVPAIILGIAFPDYALLISLLVGGILYYILMKCWILKKFPQTDIQP